jgi:hypothetical protein
MIQEDFIPVVQNGPTHIHINEYNTTHQQNQGQKQHDHQN